MQVLDRAPSSFFTHRFRHAIHLTSCITRSTIGCYRTLDPDLECHRRRWKTRESNISTSRHPDPSLGLVMPVKLSGNEPTKPVTASFDPLQPKPQGLQDYERLKPRLKVLFLLKHTVDQDEYDFLIGSYDSSNSQTVIPGYRTEEKMCEIRNGPPDKERWNRCTSVAQQLRRHQCPIPRHSCEDLAPRVSQYGPFHHHPR